MEPTPLTASTLRANSSIGGLEALGIASADFNSDGHGESHEHASVCLSAEVTAHGGDRRMVTVIQRFESALRLEVRA